MTDQRVIIEMGMGNSQHGMDYTKAARHAIEDAIRHSKLSIFKSTGILASKARIKVTIGVQEPQEVLADTLKTQLPFGTVEVVLSQGGLNVTDPGTGETVVIASAAVEVFLPFQGDVWEPTR